MVGGQIFCHSFEHSLTGGGLLCSRMKVVYTILDEAIRLPAQRNEMARLVPSILCTRTYMHFHPVCFISLGKHHCSHVSQLLHIIRMSLQAMCLLISRGDNRCYLYALDAFVNIQTRKVRRNTSRARHCVCPVRVSAGHSISKIICYIPRIKALFRESPE